MTEGRQYGSLSAYLAHWRALRRQSPRGSDNAEILAQMDQTLEQILGSDRELLANASTDSAARRHRERLETKLRRELIARGAISG